MAVYAWLALRPCKALGHTRPASMPGLSVGLPPQTKQGCLQSATQSHCTMQWHKWLTTCTGATPLRPLFYQRKRFFDSLTAPTLRSGLYVLIWLLSVAYQLLVKFILSDTSKTSSPVGIVTFPFVTVSLSLSYDFVYPSMNISGRVTVSPLFV